ncbi:MAG: inositol monophosphatase [Candidatus Sericytochromatia bacterium]|nr:inositol monophosphatase [Candidatus Tanganyikabacteria bacterium]
MLAFARQLALDVGAMLRRGQAGSLEIALKGASDVVTDMDRAAEARILEALRERFPDHAVLAEESGAHGAADYRWIVDPLDGTLNYAHRWPHWAVSIALEHRGSVVLGVVYAPVLGELFWAERGRGAFRDGERLQVSRVDRFGDALLNFGSLALRPDLPLAAQPAGRLLGAAFKTRQTGSCTLDLCWLAAGRTDACMQGNTTAWDIAAGKLILEEAGGRASGPTGEEFALGERVFVASNGTLHAELLQVLSWPPEVHS